MMHFPLADLPPGRKALAGRWAYRWAVNQVVPAKRRSLFQAIMQEEVPGKFYSYAYITNASFIRLLTGKPVRKSIKLNHLHIE